MDSTLEFDLLIEAYERGLPGGSSHISCASCHTAVDDEYWLDTEAFTLAACMAKYNFDQRATIYCDCLVATGDADALADAMQLISEVTHGLRVLPAVRPIDGPTARIAGPFTIFNDKISIDQNQSASLDELAKPMQDASQLLIFQLSDYTAADTLHWINFHELFAVTIACFRLRPFNPTSYRKFFFALRSIRSAYARLAVRICIAAYSMNNLYDEVAGCDDTGAMPQPSALRLAFDMLVPVNSDVTGFTAKYVEFGRGPSIAVATFIERYFYVQPDELLSAYRPDTATCRDVVDVISKCQTKAHLAKPNFEHRFTGGADSALGSLLDVAAAAPREYGCTLLNALLCGRMPRLREIQRAALAGVLVHRPATGATSHARFYKSTIADVVFSLLAQNACPTSQVISRISMTRLNLQLLLDARKLDAHETRSIVLPNTNLSHSIVSSRRLQRLERCSPLDFDALVGQRSRYASMVLDTLLVRYKCIWVHATARDVCLEHVHELISGLRDYNAIHRPADASLNWWHCEYISLSRVSMLFLAVVKRRIDTLTFMSKAYLSQLVLIYIVAFLVKRCNYFLVKGCTSSANYYDFLLRCVIGDLVRPQFVIALTPQILQFQHLTRDWWRDTAALRSAVICHKIDFRPYTDGDDEAHVNLDELIRHTIDRCPPFGDPHPVSREYVSPNFINMYNSIHLRHITLAVDEQGRPVMPVRELQLWFVACVDLAFDVQNIRSCIAGHPRPTANSVELYELAFAFLDTVIQRNFRSVTYNGNLLITELRLVAILLRVKTQLSLTSDAYRHALDAIGRTDFDAEKKMLLDYMCRLKLSGQDERVELSKYVIAVAPTPFNSRWAETDAPANHIRLTDSRHFTDAGVMRLCSNCRCVLSDNTVIQIRRACGHVFCQKCSACASVLKCRNCQLRVKPAVLHI